ncbi:hypothetical protein BDY19DRAFT_893731 [Irpex rosettiformis]|uniref:Uncharacterized protein n=1 Tax=Irpex rosettiformis TaxID=378272 RepID=A0ACB8TYB7_9APHY|nr:hypothetical protein BDY19DRAFT_893731 [Irpex rosettiformis]
MPVFQHPFASTEFARRSRSTESLVRWLRQERDNEPAPPVPALPPSPVAPKPPSVTAPPLVERPSTAPPPIDIDVPIRSSRSSPGHFVKHSNKVTLLLSGQEHREKIPEYGNGGIIDGIIAVPRPSGLQSLEIVVEGIIRLKEIAGGGSVQIDILRDSLFIWDAENNAPFPTKVTFRYPLPTHYSHDDSGERCRLPPTYEAHLNGLPGFRAEVSYALVVHISRTRDRIGWWRRNTSLRVPFKYVEHTRPSLPGPFLANPKAAPDLPKTLFSWPMKSRRGIRHNMRVTLYLPESQVCSLRTPIPFYVTLSGDEDTLTPFTGYRPLPESFHPLCSPNTSSGSLSQQLIIRATQAPPPLMVALYRRTEVDALGVTEANLVKAHMSTERLIAKGSIQVSSRRPDSITWSGAIAVPSRTCCGGFQTDGIKVADFIMFRITPPDGFHSGLVECSESIPMKLTTDPYDCNSAAVTISSDWSG